MSMKPNFTQKKAGLLALALLAAMTAPATAHGATPVSVAPASQPSGDQHAARLTTAGDKVSSAEVPTLTNDVGQPHDGTEQQLSLALGFGLIGVGLLGLPIGLAMLLATRREPAAPADPYASTSSTTAPVAAQTGEGTRFTLMRDDRRGRA